MRQIVSVTPKDTDKLGTKLLLPVVDAVLAGKTAGFTGSQIQSLSTVRWQAHLLEQDADWMKEFFGLTFTTDDANHDIVTSHLDARVRDYAFRAGVLLKCVRVSLKLLS